jgi:hypothetical protein
MLEEEVENEFLDVVEHPAAFADGGDNAVEFFVYEHDLCSSFGDAM